MAAKSVNFANTACNICESHLETIAKWLSCNGEIWGVGPTAVFASAAILFLYNELEATVFLPGDQEDISSLEKTLISTMMLGMLALMIHLWVCSMRFFQYYLDTLIRDSPSMLLEMTTAGLLGRQSDVMPLGPITMFLRQQQPQIHITVCWFLSLCYADYVRKTYCQRFNLPYLEQWQTELQERMVRTTHQVMERVNSFVGTLHQQLHGFAQTNSQIRNNEEQQINTVRVRPLRHRRLSPVDPATWHQVPASSLPTPARAPTRPGIAGYASSERRARLRLMLLENLERISKWHTEHPPVLSKLSTVEQTTATIPSVGGCPWQHMKRMQIDCHKIVSHHLQVS